MRLGLYRARIRVGKICGARSRRILRNTWLFPRAGQRACDNTAAKTWPCFPSKQLLIIAICPYPTLTPFLHWDLHIFRTLFCHLLLKLLSCRVVVVAKLKHCGVLPTKPISERRRGLLPSSSASRMYLITIFSVLKSPCLKPYLVVSRKVISVVAKVLVMVKQLKHFF